ncbi:MAG: hypothetical protein RLZZ31_648 [Actinomycetota bacterium]
MRGGGQVPETSMSLADAAKHLGVHYMTAYRYVRTGKLPAIKSAGEWRVEQKDVQAILSPSTRPQDGRIDRHDLLRNRLIAGDENGTWSVIESALHSGVTPIEVYIDLLGPALASIGEGWAAGEVSIAEEHRATTVTNRIIGRMGPMFTHPGRSKGTVIIGAPAGDQHSVPTAMAGDLLRSRHFSVIDLGADTPFESFRDAIAIADRLIAIGLHVATSDLEDSARQLVAELRNVTDRPIVVGGSGASERIGADAVSHSPTHMLEIFDQFTAGAGVSAG